MKKNILSVKRCCGLGNVFLLIPVLDKAYQLGYRIQLITNNDWIEYLKKIRPHFSYNTNETESFIDLDYITKDLNPNIHRTIEFGELLDIQPPYPKLRIEVNNISYLDLLQYKDSIIIAPEANHISRSMRSHTLHKLLDKLDHYKTVIIGKEDKNSFPATFDLRSKLTLDKLIQLIHVSSAIICMDSGILHIARALNKKTLVIFGGIDPKYRIGDIDKTIIYRKNLNCSPCNKIETCQGKYHCINTLDIDHIFNKLTSLLSN